MKNTLLHIRRLAVAAALLGVVLSPRAASSQSMLDTSEAEAFLGMWIVSLETDFGAFDMNLNVEDKDGKVAAEIGSPDFGGMTEITDITREGDDLVMIYDVDAQGQMIEVSVTLSVDGDGLAAEFDFGGQMMADGTATRAGN